MKRVVWRKSRHSDKAFMWRFVPNIRKLHNFQESLEYGSIECPRDVFITHPLYMVYMENCKCTQEGT